ncbi:MAG: 30S ribosome-binding factor RbfA [Paludibacteraceae bacterium]|nr:30S ribosome-binding factor RbfA [Paludibacteraceae bacterium]
MDKTRLNKIDRLIQKEMSDMFQKSVNSMNGTLVTVTSVSVSADLSIARVRLSIFPTDRQEETMALIKNSTRALRGELGQRVRYQLRKVPELTFFIDDSLDYIENIDRLLGKNKTEE